MDINPFTVRRLFKFIAGFFNWTFSLSTTAYTVCKISWLRNTGSLAALPGEAGGVVREPH